MVLDWIDITLCVAYLLVVFGLAIWSARGQHDNEEYFLGGRRMNWFVVGMSMFATSFSSISFLGLPQRGAFQDFSFYFTILLIPFLITPILWWLFVPFYVRLGLSSGYEYLGKRFGRPIQRIGSLLYAAYAIGWMGTMLYAVALTLQTVLGLTDTEYIWALIGIGAFATAYTALGGFKAVVWTDMVQAIVMGVAVVAIFALALKRIDGGFDAFLRIGLESGKFRMFHLDSDLLAVENFTASNTVYTAVAFAIFMYLPGYAVSQNMIQRYICAGSVKNGRGVVGLSALTNAGLGLVFMAVGAALFAFYSQPGGLGMPELGVDIATEDQILPYFVSTQLAGTGLAGLLMAGLFAAAMSTVDSGINGVTSVIVYDWLSGRALPVTFSRILTVLLGAAVIGAALLAPVIGENVLGIITAIAGTSLGMILAVFLLGMFVSRANMPGVLIGLSAGLICLAAAMLFANIPNWWLGVFAFFPTLIVGMVTSYFWRESERKSQGKDHIPQKEPQHDE